MLIAEPLLPVMRKLIFILRSVLSVSIGDCGYDTLRSDNEKIKVSWDEVANQYRRQADIAPVLLNSVKSHAAHELDMLRETPGPCPNGFHPGRTGSA